MKKTNRVIAALAAMIMMLTLVAGCGNNAADEPKAESVVGKWTVVSATLQSEEFDLNSAGLTIGMEFKDDGSVTIGETSSMLPDSTEQNFSGTWTQDGEDVTITVDDESVYGKLEDGKLTFSDDSTSMVLERE